LEQTLITQALKTQQQRVAGKSGEALVRRIAVSGGIQRQHLPQLLSRSQEEVCEFVGAGAEIADAEAARKRSEVEQNSTTSRKFHSVTIRRSAASGQGDDFHEISRARSALHDRCVGRTLTVVLDTCIFVLVVDAWDFHLQSNVVLVFLDVHLTVAMSDGEGQHSAFPFEPQKIKMAVAPVAISSYHFKETGTVALA
jgi:hypothetical protein